MKTTRRELLALLAATPACMSQENQVSESSPPFRISLAEWSLHRALRGGELDHLDLARKAREDFDLGAVEYVSTFFEHRVRDLEYLEDMRRRCSDHGVESLLIMVDGQGHLADADAAARERAIENHHPWVDAAALLGCHSIRVNAAGDGEREEVARRAADSLVRIADYAAPHGTSVIVENHGGLSSDGSWLASVMRRADDPHVGTLPDFGNFHLGDDQWYDRYQGVEEVMRFARADSAKSHEFDAAGHEVTTDYRRMLGLVLAAGYRGHVGVEYEGDAHSEVEGVHLTKALLERVRDELAAK